MVNVFWSINDKTANSDINLNTLNESITNMIHHVYYQVMNLPGIYQLLFTQVWSFLKRHYINLPIETSTLEKPSD